MTDPYASELTAPEAVVLLRGLDQIDELNKLPPDEHDYRWDNSDLIAQEVMGARSTLRALSPRAAELQTYKDELLKIAESIGEGNDPFAAREAIEALSAALEAERAKTADGSFYQEKDIDALQADREILHKAGIVEIAARNPNVMEYIKHWEARAEAAEAQLTVLKAELEEAVEVVKWYGCEKNWTTENPYEECSIDLDEGNCARAFLDRHQKETGT